MIRIICSDCKNAYLQKNGDMLECPSCGASISESEENLLLGIQYFNEGNLTEAGNSLMKYIVKNGAEPRAIFYKALLDAYDFDEDTVSLSETYKKLSEALGDISDDDFPKYIALANDESEKLEKALVESHVRLFGDADAEKIKRQVSVILNIQNEARNFRSQLQDFVIAFNERSSIKISAKFSDCFYVDYEIAAEVGNIKYEKIRENIASHTVFTGILSNDIKNLEIYFRCIVMFFRKSHDKYEFLLNESAKFAELAEILEQGRYNTIKGTAAIGEKLKTVSYDFLQESYKEHFDEQIDIQNETVVIMENVLETEEEAAPEAVENTDEEAEEAEEINEVTVEAPVTEEPASNNTDNESETEKSEVIAEFTDNEETIVEIEASEEPANTADEKNEDEMEDISSSSPVAEVIISEEIAEEKTEEAVEEISEEAEISAEEETSEDTVIVIDSTEESVKELSDEEAGEKATQDENTEETPQEEGEKIPEDVSASTEDKPKKKKKSHKGLIIFILIILAALAVAAYKYAPGIINDYKYDKATSLAAEGNYTEAITLFTELGDYEDSAEKVKECSYNNALALEEDESFAKAAALFKALGDYKDSAIRNKACIYGEASGALEKGNYDEATKLFKTIKDYGDSSDKINECSYRKASSLMEEKQYESAIEIFSDIKEYSDSADKINEAKYIYVTENFSKENKTTVKYIKELAEADYRNSKELKIELLGEEAADVIAFVNYSKGDTETKLTSLDNTKPVYFHVIVNDKDLYGTTLTLKYTTAFGYKYSSSARVSESGNHVTLVYPATRYKNYTVEFFAVDSNGNTVASQKISF